MIRAPWILKKMLSNPLSFLSFPFHSIAFLFLSYHTIDIQEQRRQADDAGRSMEASAVAAGREQMRKRAEKAEREIAVRNMQSQAGDSQEQTMLQEQAKRKELENAKVLTADGQPIAELTLQDETAFKQTVQPFITKHCVSCHGPEKQKGKLRLDTLGTDFTKSVTAGTWIEVMDKMNLGEMPPEEEPQPRIEK